MHRSCIWWIICTGLREEVVYVSCGDICSFRAGVAKYEPEFAVLMATAFRFWMGTSSILIPRSKPVHCICSARKISSV
jgi:hypothetical protein